MANARQASLLQRVRDLCLAFPEVSERLSHGEVTWFIREKKVLAMMDDHHHGEHLFAVTVPALPGVQEELIEAAPDRFYRPKYVGPAGWVGVHLDGATDWDELGAILEDAYRMKAPKALVKLLDAR